jgi:V8-like Glu-specific endopeptidase
VEITNHHVVSGGTGKGGCIGGIITQEDSFEPDYFFNLSFVTTDVTNDNAIGRIKNNFNYEKLLYVKNVKEMDEYPYLKLNSSNKIGQTINALGYPDIANGSIVLTKGIISSKTKINDYNYILSDVNVSYGNSGGAIINDKGELLGLATSVQHSDISSLTYILQIDFIKIQKLFWDKVNPTEFLKEELDNINEVLTTNGLSS